MSTAGSEKGMLEDFEQGVRMLSGFSFRIMPPRGDNAKAAGRKAGAGAGAGVTPGASPFARSASGGAHVPTGNAHSRNASTPSSR